MSVVSGGGYQRPRCLICGVRLVCTSLLCTGCSRPSGREPWTEWGKARARERAAKLAATDAPPSDSRSTSP